MNDYPTNLGSIQTPGFQICWDDVDSHREEVGATKSSDLADIPSRAQSATTYNDQEFLSVGEFLSNEPLGELPRDTLPGLDFGKASTVLSHLIDEITEDVEKQRDEVAKEHWAQNKKHWDATEGMRLKEHYKGCLDKSYNMISEKKEREYILAYHEHWQTDERPKYYEVLRAQLEDEVKAEVRKELEPTVRADVRKHHLASLREEVSRAFVHGISPFQRTSRFAEKVIGPRLRANHSEREEDAD
ncbi:MAG: hypothetical protein Q9180_003852 [Flavoplaca navasiana]